MWLHVITVKLTVQVFGGPQQACEQISLGLWDGAWYLKLCSPSASLFWVYPFSENQTQKQTLHMADTHFTRP
jgi:hypothetical protein